MFQFISDQMAPVYCVMLQGDRRPLSSLSLQIDHWPCVKQFFKVVTNEKKGRVRKVAYARYRSCIVVIDVLLSLNLAAIF